MMACEESIDLVRHKKCKETVRNLNELEQFSVIVHIVCTLQPFMLFAWLIFMSCSPPKARSYRT